jgi:hypothetical protein
MQQPLRVKDVLISVRFSRLLLLPLLLGVTALAQQVDAKSGSPAPPIASIVVQMERAQMDSRPGVSYQVVREYRLFSEKSATPSSEVVAEVDYLPPDRKTYEIQKHTGSSRGQDVVRRILQHESQMVAGGKSWSGAVIDGNNYDFSYLGEANRDGNSCYLLGLDPKRKETELIRGKAWVDKRSFLIRHIEGQMAKNPSWMLKRVDVKIDFADVGGAWLQTGMEAVADVRFIGNQTLRSQTVDARVGEVVAQKMSPAARAASRRYRRAGLPASVIVPMDRRP